jgi:hypothetical protein
MATEWVLAVVDWREEEVEAEEAQRVHLQGSYTHMLHVETLSLSAAASMHAPNMHNHFTHRNHDTSLHAITQHLTKLFLNQGARIPLGCCTGQSSA